MKGQSRRELLRAMGVPAGSAGTLSVWPGCAGGERTADGMATRPNIISIMSDDHASHAMSCYGSRINETPNLDRIAKEGIRFDNAFCTNSICGAILTGKYNHLRMGALRPGEGRARAT